MGPSGLLLTIFILICLSTFFSLAETAFISVPMEKVFKMSQDGNKKAKNLLKLFSSNEKEKTTINKDKIISIVLLCNNIVNISASSLSAVFFAEQFGEYDEIGILLSTAIMTILIFVFGEVLPKMIAVRQSTKIAITLASFFSILSKLLSPILFIINNFTTAIVKILHIKNETDGEDPDISLMGAVEMYHQQGVLENAEKEMLNGVLQLDEIDFKDIMTHRSEMVAVDINGTNEEIWEQIMNTKFTKIPVYDKSDDNMIGVLNINNLMKYVYYNKDMNNINFRQLLVEPWYLPGDASISKHLQEFKDRGNALAFIVDEYGGIMGIVTLEDILEEIVGDIKSNDDDKPDLCIQNSDGSFLVDADMNLLDVNTHIGSNFEDSEVSSIGGFLIHKIQHIPTINEMFDINGYKFIVVETEANRILKMNIKKNGDKENNKESLKENSKKDKQNNNNELFKNS